MKYRMLLAMLVISMAAALPARSKDFVKPVAKAADAYAAHDDHASDKVSIGADPYDNADKAKIFSINFSEHGFLPVFLVVTNDSNQPISIANMQVTLTTASRDKLTPAASEDIFRRLSNPRANTHPIPVPIPQKKVKGALSDKDKYEVETAQFAAKAVEPHTTQSGFLFFDVEDIPKPVAGAHLYVSGVDDAKGTELMYFELSLSQ